MIFLRASIRIVLLFETCFYSRLYGMYVLFYSNCVKIQMIQRLTWGGFNEKMDHYIVYAIYDQWGYMNLYSILHYKVR